MKNFQLCSPFFERGFFPALSSPTAPSSTAANHLATMLHQKQKFLDLRLMSPKPWTRQLFEISAQPVTLWFLEMLCPDAPRNTCTVCSRFSQFVFWSGTMVQEVQVDLSHVAHDCWYEVADKAS